LLGELLEGKPHEQFLWGGAGNGRGSSALRQSLTRQVNHREEKHTLGVGQAQLWNVTSFPKQPPFAVACYSAVLLASLQAFGAERGKAYAALPKWRRRAARPSALDLIALLRKEMADSPEIVAHLGLNPTDQTHIAAAAA
jgi:hypothetical protein